MRAPLKTKNRQSGFTIIEIMIVLAVASLIMLIVFLAVPALQRNARNTNRTSDATKIAAAVNECLANTNDTVASCNTVAAISGVTLDVSTLRKLTTLGVTGAFPAVANTTTANFVFGQKCTSDGTNFAAGDTAQFVVIYNAETASSSTHRCING